MRVYKRIVFRMRPKLQIGCSIDGKKGKLCIGKVYFFSQKKLLQYIKYFSWSRWTRNFPGTCIPSPSPKFTSCSVTASFQLLKLANLLEFTSGKCPTNSFHFSTHTTYLSFKMIHRVEIFNSCSWSLLFIQCSFCFVHL